MHVLINEYLTVYSTVNYINLWFNRFFFCIIQLQCGRYLTYIIYKLFYFHNSDNYINNK